MVIVMMVLFSFEFPTIHEDDAMNALGDTHTGKFHVRKIKTYGQPRQRSAARRAPCQRPDVQKGERRERRKGEGKRKRTVFYNNKA
jgi:hypothetical protein